AVDRPPLTAAIMACTRVAVVRSPVTLDAMTIIDVHTHMCTRRWLELLRAQSSPYNVQQRPDGREEVFRGDTPVVFPQPGHFDYGVRLRAMEEDGVTLSSADA